MPIIAAMIAAFGGGIVSGFLVHILTQSREREKWVLDCKKEEYKELLTALSRAHMSTRAASPGYLAFNDNPQKYASITEIQNDSIRIFTDRIFIKTDLNLDELQKAWRDSMSEFSYFAKWDITSTTSPEQNFDSEYSRIKDEIVAAANLAVPKSTSQRLQFWKD